MDYALIKAGRVADVIVVGAEDAEFIATIASEWDHIEPLDTTYEQGLGVGIGWGWEGHFVPPESPAEPPVAPAPRNLTKRAFWNRFPALKEATLRAVRLGAPVGHLVLVGMLDRLNSRVESSPYVSLDDVQTIEGVTWLASPLAPETVQLDGQPYPLRLSQAEAEAILQPDPVGAEVYTG